MKPDIDAILATFPRLVPVFPLAGVVLFPGALLPLHIFEPRYQQMLEDVLAGDRLIGMALLKPCSAEQYELAPPFHATVCVGQVIHHEALPAGKSNIALLGISAASAEKAPSDRPYCTARLELLADTLDTQPEHERKLAGVFGRTVSGHADLAGLRLQLEQFLEQDRILGAMINTCALTGPVFPLHKQQLLEERSLARRLDRLCELLERPWQWN